MVEKKYVIVVSITDGEQSSTMAALDISSEPWHATINTRDYRPEARHGLAFGLRLLADKLDEYKGEESK